MLLMNVLLLGKWDDDDDDIFCMTKAHIFCYTKMMKTWILKLRNKKNFIFITQE